MDKDKLVSHYMDNNTELHNLTWDLILCPTVIDKEARHVAKCTVSVFKGCQSPWGFVKQSMTNQQLVFMSLETSTNLLGTG